jgi:hypothetical protein
MRALSNSHRKLFTLVAVLIAGVCCFIAAPSAEAKNPDVLQWAYDQAEGRQAYALDLEEVEVEGERLNYTVQVSIDHEHGLLGQLAGSTGSISGQSFSIEGSVLRADLVSAGHVRLRIELHEGVSPKAQCDALRARIKEMYKADPRFDRQRYREARAEVSELLEGQLRRALKDAEDLALEQLELDGGAEEDPDRRADLMARISDLQQRYSGYYLNFSPLARFLEIDGVGLWTGARGEVGDPYGKRHKGE